MVQHNLMCNIQTEHNYNYTKLCNCLMITINLSNHYMLKMMTEIEHTYR
jgi:hypothetical protein